MGHREVEDSCRCSWAVVLYTRLAGGIVRWRILAAVVWHAIFSSTRLTGDIVMSRILAALVGLTFFKPG